MKIKTSELEGTALNWAVAKAAGYTISYLDLWYDIKSYDKFTPSTDWSFGGPIIEQEKIRLDCAWNPGPWEGSCKIDGVTAWVEGPTPLIAAMRCYVASKLGDEVEIPEELVG